MVVKLLFSLTILLKKEACYDENVPRGDRHLQQSNRSNS